MSLLNETNLKRILKTVPHNSIITTKWLRKNGISRQLLQKYKNSNWLEKLANGAYLKIGDDKTFDGAIYALQSQLGLNVHIGGLSALKDYYHLVHNVPFKDKKLQLFTFRGEKIPKWFKTLYNDNFELNASSFLDKENGFSVSRVGSLSLKIPTLERAILEMCYLVPEKITLQEAYQILESITIAKPKEMQILLENCKSIKVKRIFLYMANLISHPWLEKIDTSKIDLGKGVREITKGGTYSAKYKIIVGEISKI